jgi:hypothetical protein
MLMRAIENANGDESAEPHGRRGSDGHTANGQEAPSVGYLGRLCADIGRAMQLGARHRRTPHHSQVFVESAEADARIEREIYRGRRYNRPLSMVLIELPVDVGQGGYLVDALNAALSGRIRRTDFGVQLEPANHIAILCPETMGDQAEAFARRLLPLIEQAISPFASRGTIRLAVASFPEVSSTFDGLLSCAIYRLQDVRSTMHDPITVPLPLSP